MTKQVRLHTNLGSITLALDDEKAPRTVANFIDYIALGHYDGTLFHRVIPGFMVQGGGFDLAGSQKATKSPIENEATNGLKNDRYTIAMARTPAPHSASAQFFINIVDNAMLDHTAPTPQGWGYAVFGHVIDGTDVVDRIAAVKTARRGPHGDWPVDDVAIERAEVLS